MNYVFLVDIKIIPVFSVVLGFYILRMDFKNTFALNLTFIDYNKNYKIKPEIATQIFYLKNKQTKN